MYCHKQSTSKSQTLLMTFRSSFATSCHCHHTSLRYVEPFCSSMTITSSHLINDNCNSYEFLLVLHSNYDPILHRF